MSGIFVDERCGTEDEPVPAPSTREREAAIFQVLRRPEAAEGLSVAEIAARAKEYLRCGPQPAGGKRAAPEAHLPKRDTVTVQAYHKLVNRLVALGRVEEAPGAGERGERRYRLAPYLHAANPITLDDIYEWALQPSLKSQLPPTEFLAHLANASDYLGEKKRSVLKEAAEALTREDPRELFFRMIRHFFEVLQRDLAVYAEPSLRDPAIKARVEREALDLDILLYRMLGIPPEVVDITGLRQWLREAETGTSSHGPQMRLPSEHTIRIDEERLWDVLQRRVFGPTFFYRLDVGATRGSPARKRLTVAGSDGSTHAGLLQVRTAREYVEEDEMIVSFNNAMVYVHQSANAPHRAESPYHSVPISRAALDDPDNRGMILARPMYPELDDAVYEHLLRCTTDVVQWRVDEAVFSGVARPISPTNISHRPHEFTLPAPSVQIRDGSAVPQEREFQHYKRLDAYGDMVREGLNRVRSIVQRLRTEDNKQVFAGAVKSTSLRVFSKVVSWYIAHGSKYRVGGDRRPIDPTWEDKYAAGLSDNQTMTYLMSALLDGREAEAREGSYWLSCVIGRPFHAGTEFYQAKGVTDDAGWKRFFGTLAAHEERSARWREETWLWETQDWEDDAFAYLCRRADFGLFYVGHTGGNPAPYLPRYEFLDSLRSRDPEEAASRVAENVRRVVEALDQTHVAIDADHNFATQKQLVKIVPYVVHRAHEACKTLGSHLEAELRAAVISRLSHLRRLRGLRPNDVALLPVNLRRYLERTTTALRRKAAEDPGSCLR